MTRATARRLRAPRTVCSVRRGGAQTAHARFRGDRSRRAGLKRLRAPFVVCDSPAQRHADAIAAHLRVAIVDRCGTAWRRNDACVSCNMMTRLRVAHLARTRAIRRTRRWRYLHTAALLCVSCCGRTSFAERPRRLQTGGERVLRRGVDITAAVVAGAAPRAATWHSWLRSRVWTSTKHSEPF